MSNETVGAVVGAVVAATVWLLDFDADGPEGGDYVGYVSVHATRDGALLRLFDRIHELGVDPRSDDVQVRTRAEYPDGAGEAAELRAGAWEVSYSVRRAPVEP